MTPAAAVARFLRGRYGPDVDAIVPLAQGQWSRAYAFRHDDRDFVVRFSARDEDFRKDQLAARFSTATLPIPAIMAVGETDEGCYAVAERVAGGYLDELDGAQMRAILPSLFAALDAMRHTDLTGTSGFGIWGADGSAPHASWRAALLAISNDHPGDRIHGWRARLAASPIASDAFARAYQRLGALAARRPPSRCLIHGDLLNFNVLTDGNRISGVIDWGCAMYGDFLYDVAWFAFWAPWYPAWRGIDFAAAARRHYDAIGLDVPSFAARLACCQIHIGLAGMAYQAYTERWELLHETARRTLLIETPVQRPGQSGRSGREEFPQAMLEERQRRA